MRQPPLVSVIVPVRDAGATLDEQMDALATQTFRGDWEVVVSDNGSTDDTVERALRWEPKLPSLRVVDSSGRRGVAHARNAGIAAAKGDLVLICDGDDVVAADWVERMVAALATHQLVTGYKDVTLLNEPWQYTWPAEPDAVGLDYAYGFKPYAEGGNQGMRREVFELLGGYDESIRRAEDIDFGWRAAYAGITVHYEPTAVVFARLHRRPLAVGRGALRGGMSEPLLYRRHRSHGMPREPGATTAETWWWIVRHLPAALAGRESRHRWAFHAGSRTGRLLGSIRYRVLYL